MQVRYAKRAKNIIRDIIDSHIMLSGSNSAIRFAENIDRTVKDLLRYPCTGHPEPLLSNMKVLHRAKKINKNYKLIYHLTSNSIYIDDVWDMRRNPSTLAKRFKQ